MGVGKVAQSCLQAAFLDRDEYRIRLCPRRQPYRPARIGEFEMISGTALALASPPAADFLMFVVTNPTRRCAKNGAGLRYRTHSMLLGALPGIACMSVTTTTSARVTAANLNPAFS
jgi:hypothetical protein